MRSIKVDAASLASTSHDRAVSDLAFLVGPVKAGTTTLGDYIEPPKAILTGKNGIPPKGLLVLPENNTGSHWSLDLRLIFHWCLKKPSKVERFILLLRLLTYFLLLSFFFSIG